MRIALTPAFLYLALTAESQASRIWVFIIFVVCAISDWLDGKIARKYNIISNFGKIWDPLADKFIVLAALLVLTWIAPFRLHPLVFSIIAVREILVTILRDIYARRRIIIPADRWGKLKTVTQMVGIIFCLACWMLDWMPGAVIAGSRMWFWLVAVLTVFSGMNYVRARHETQ
jgi:CDP-diacylglycerol--glycerol-3-phosphate 3-phosphatidyltransferase